jgi:hypothetical protein
MPAKTVQSSLAKELGEKARAAHEAHKNDEVRYGIVNLPSGITGGVAQLVNAKWDKYKSGKNKDQPYVLLRGIAKTPVEHANVLVQGQGVMQMIPLCDTPDRKLNGEPGTLEAWYSELLNEFRKLGVDTAATEFNDIDGILQMLEKDKPHFRFSTRGWTPPKTAQNQNPSEMVFTQFDGVCEFSDNGQAEASGVRDGTASVGAGESDAPPSSESEVSDDLETLLAQADADDADAQVKIRELAAEAGIDQETIDSDDTTWAGLVELIGQVRGGSEEGEGEAAKEPEPEPFKPEKGQTFKYQLKGKDKKPLKGGPVKVEVLSVNTTKETVTLKNLATKKPVLGADNKLLAVPWAELLDGEGK